MSKIYISGQISGLPMDEVKAKFALAEQFFFRQGYEVVNPVNLDHSKNTSEAWNEYMKTDIKALMDCDIVAFLPCWCKSTGAILEFNLAKQLELPFIFLDGMHY